MAIQTCLDTFFLLKSKALNVLQLNFIIIWLSIEFAIKKPNNLIFWMVLAITCIDWLAYMKKSTINLSKYNDLDYETYWTYII